MSIGLLLMRISRIYANTLAIPLATPNVIDSLLSKKSMHAAARGRFIAVILTILDAVALSEAGESPILAFLYV
jgi:hypothetical protein